MPRQPWRIAAAALLRKRTLRLGELNGSLPTSLTPLSSAFASTTAHPLNMYILASGAEEGLEAGERLEVYGSTVRLVHAVAYDQRMNNNNNRRGHTRDRVTCEMAVLQAITAQLGKVHAMYQNGLQASSTARQATRDNKDDSSNKHHQQASAAGQSDDSAHGAAELSPVRLVRHAPQILPGLQGDNAEVVLAEWAMQGDAAEESKTDAMTTSSSSSSSLPQQHAADTPNKGDDDEAATATDNNNNNDSSNSNKVSESEEPMTLLTENGIYFPSAAAAGLRVMRAARLAFLARVQATAMTFSGLDLAASRACQSLYYTSASHAAGGNARPPGTQHTLGASSLPSTTSTSTSNNSTMRRRSIGSGGGDEPHRPLAILDVSEMDASCAETALQAAAEAGLQAETEYHVSYVPLTHVAAQGVGPAMLASNALRLVMERPGYAHARPLELLHSYYFDTAAYTAYVDLRTRHTVYSKDFGTCRSEDGREGWHVHEGRGSMSSAAAARAEDVKRLALAMTTLRRGAAMLVTLLPTPVSVAALRREVEARRPACDSVDVEIEAAVVREAKRLVAAAISRTGRWASITDEILPAVDAPQGSAVSLMVIVE